MKLNPNSEVLERLEEAPVPISSTADDIPPVLIKPENTAVSRPTTPEDISSHQQHTFWWYFDCASTAKAQRPEDASNHRSAICLQIN